MAQPLAEGLRQLLLASCSAVLEVSGDGRIVAVATAAGDELGLMLAQQRGCEIRDLLEDPQGDDGEAQLAALLSGETLPLGCSFRLRLPDRPATWVQVAARRIADQTRGVLLSVRPVDARAGGTTTPSGGRPLTSLGGGFPAREPGRGRRIIAEEEETEALLGPASTAREAEMATSLRQRLEEVGRLRRQVDELLSARRLFLSASAHELKTPLTILQVYLETLLDELADGLSEEQLSFLRVCHESTLRLRRLVVDLVDLAALESGDIQLSFSKVELLPVIDAVVGELEPLARHADVTLRVPGGEEIPAVRTDPARAQQVLRNLVDNAVRHTPAGGTVTVSATACDGGVRVTVSDTGVGIRADRLESILRGGGPEHASGAGGGRGSGVGLAVSRRLALALGGRLTAHSVEGQGSSFAVSLPVWS